MTRVVSGFLVPLLCIAVFSALAGCTSAPPVPPTTPVPVSTTAVTSPSLSATPTPPELTLEEYLKTHPPAPQNLRAISGGVCINLSWDAPARVTVPHLYSDTVAYYRIYRGTTEKDLTFFTTAAGRSFRDCNSSESSEGMYQVTAVMTGETESSPSEDAMAGPVQETRTGEGLTYEQYRSFTPPPPQNLTAVLKGTSVDLRWDPPARADGAHQYSDTVAYYRIYKGSSGNKITYFTSTGERLFRDTNVTPGGTYFYEVTAVMAGETESTAGSRVQITVP